MKKTRCRTAAVLVNALANISAPVRAETALSLVKLGYIPPDARALLEDNLNYHKTLLPAASALFHLTGHAEYFTILQEVAEGDNDKRAARPRSH